MTLIYSLKSFVYKNNNIRKFRQLVYVIRYFFSPKKKLVLFAIPFGNIVNGGVISICKIYQASSEILKSDSVVLMFTTKSSPNFLKFSQFKNTAFVVNHNVIDLILRFKNFQSVIIHIPEYYFENFIQNNFSSQLEKLKLQKKLTINVLNQKIEEMPSPEVFNKCKNCFGPIFTITTAHRKYGTEYYKLLYDVPYHYLSVNVDESYYPKLLFSEKENTILISPDFHELKGKILSNLKSRLPDFKFVTIKNLTFEQYKELVAKSKFQITFGEGLDGYFIEPYFCNSIGFAVYNEEFFTEKYRKLETVYESYEQLENSIVSDIFKLNSSESEYVAKWKAGFEVCKTDYNTANFLNNLRGYYKKEFKVTDSREL